MERAREEDTAIVESLFLSYEDKGGAPTRARLYLCLDADQRDAFATLPVETQIALLRVPNKQKGRYRRGGYGEGAAGVTAYCTFKTGQKSAAQAEKEERFQRHIQSMIADWKRARADRFYM